MWGEYYMSFAESILHEGISVIPEELINSTDKILKYAGISDDKGRIFKINLDYFRNLEDKNVFDSESSKIVKMINIEFFEIYQKVLKRVLREKDSSQLYRLFLNFAYMDEKLLQTEHSRLLYDLVDELDYAEQGSVNSTARWLEKIYKKEEEPSVNEYGQDYFDIFREKVKRGQLQAKDKSEYDNNIDGRLDHEMNNLLKIGQKLCSGHINDYCPILHSGMIKSDLSKMMLDQDRIEASLDKILKVDFSAFHREIVYNQPETGISKELIMKSVLPYFILMPTVGSRAIMWQEVSGKVKSSPGRFVLPVLAEGDLDNLMTEMVAKFRWDLSKNMFSYGRGDEYQSSLTGDYSQYIQFYKKNLDLSNDAKQKIKTQILKYRNNVREMFAADYSIWINYESKGLVRLNKAVRDIFFKHCPFSKSIRDDLARHPLYSQYITVYEGARVKRSKVYQARYSKMLKPNIPLDADLIGNLAYYEM